MEDPKFDHLLIGCRRSTAAFQELISEYADPIYTFLVHMTGRENADGLFPEVWLRIHDSAGLYKPEGNPKAFLFTIAHQTAQGYYTPAKSSPTDLKTAIACLPPDLRLIFLLRQVGQLPYKKIAVRLEMPLEIVLKRMNAAIDALAEPLEKHCA